MSKIGNQPIKLVNGVQVKFEQSGIDRNKVTVTGPKGELFLDMRKGIDLDVTADQVIVKSLLDSNKNLYGLYRTLVANMIQGVTEGYKVDLEIQGIGFKAEVQGRSLVMKLGYSHQKIVAIPEGITLEVKDNVLISVTGIDKQQVTQFASNIRSQRKPEPYKGKGIRYAGEKVRRKVGKAAGK